ncbi:hypothetical protein SAMN05421766_10737 [Zobellia uliginosa]|uniref:Virulence surface antigen n=1 Tax=Zobellia uliginosa TaxID=143224 RepID=A0ABY1L0G4_9FLAO|nr:hypothetical protein [Zobellia uliginosa]SIT01758.1 hypothetical protein SAMN05421766_10737 [Zobellia uliginosa]
MRRIEQLKQRHDLKKALRRAKNAVTNIDDAPEDDLKLKQRNTKAKAQLKLSLKKYLSKSSLRKSYGLTYGIPLESRYRPPTDYVNKQTGESVYVNDGINQTVEIDNNLWKYADYLSNNRIRSPYSDAMNQILIKNSSLLSSTSFSFNNSDLAVAQLYQKRNNSNGKKRHDCLTTVCEATRRLYPGENLNLAAAMTMILPGNADGNNMNKTMRHLLDIGKAGGQQLTFEKTNGGAYGDIGSQLLGRTSLNSTSVWGLSLSNAYHSLMVYVERTNGGAKFHIVDQFSFETVTDLSSFNNIIDNHFHGPWNNHKTIFTQYQH